MKNKKILIGIGVLLLICVFYSFKAALVGVFSLFFGTTHIKRLKDQAKQSSDFEAHVEEIESEGEAVKSDKINNKKREVDQWLDR